MARFLNLTLEDIDPNRTRAVLARIEAVMLFPNDSDSEKQQLLAEYGRVESYMTAPADFATVDVQRWLRAAPRIEPLQAEIRRRFIIGMSIGRVVANLLCDNAKTLRTSLLDAENRFNLIRGEEPPLHSLQKNWWPHFKTVGHLWASSYSLCVWTPNQIFPCALGDLPGFLAAAEHFRLLGEQHILKGTQAKLLLLPRQQTYGVPFEVVHELPLSPVFARPGSLQPRTAQ